MLITREPICILLLIPCYNEEDNIENIIEHLLKVKDNVSKRDDCILDILIINDGSNDTTKEILDTCCYHPEFTIIHFNRNRGYGAVLKEGFKFAGEQNYRWLISFDMDGQHEPKCLYRFLDKIHQEGKKNDIISGSRYLDPAMFLQNPWKDRFLVNMVITGILNSIGFSLTDSFCGMKAHYVERINELEILHDGYEMPIEMLLRSKDNCLLITEIAVPVIYKCRDTVIKKSTPDSLLFKKGEERIEKYLEIIKELHGDSLVIDNQRVKEVFTKYFNAIREINKENFAGIQKKIFAEISDLHLNSPRELSIRER
ncbi:MAG: glycosyltransferase family 2 protein [Promethearchaeota archaeon]